MAAYYNEIDPQAAQWLRNLIAAGHIAPGDVDERSVWDVHPGDLEPYVQCHFFAGVGVWSHALRSAGWADDRPVWTGSCPCQPFSQAGKGRAQADDRHHWPAWAHLIRERRPSRIFGEQVEGPDGVAWLDAVQTDLETLGYAFGPFVLPAAGFGAPHGRHRAYFVADADVQRREGQRLRLLTRRSHQDRSQVTGGGEAGLVGDADNPGWEGRGERGDGANQRAAGPAGVVGGFWRDAEWVYCSDDKWRAVEPGAFPLANGSPTDLVRIRAYGNAIVAPVAQEFIRACLDVSQITPSQSVVLKEK